MQSNNFQVGADLLWEDAGPGIKRQIFGYDEKVMMVKVLFEKGAIGQMHEHPHTQVTYVEKGIFEMTIGDDIKVIQSGDGFFVPPNVQHGCRCIEPGVLIDVFSPMREDFLTLNK